MSSSFEEPMLLHHPVPSAWLSRLPIRSRRRYPREDLIVGGHPKTAVERNAYMVLDGIVRLSLLAIDGKEQVIAYLPRGSLFGEQAALGGRALEPQLVALADEDCEVGEIAAADIIELVRDEPTALSGLMEITGQKTSLFLQALVRSSAGSAGPRIATLLETLAAERGQVAISQERLAALSGLTRVTVAKQLHQFEARGAIQLERSRIVILDVGLLNYLAHEPFSIAE